MARTQGGAPVSVRLAVVGGTEAKREFSAFGESGKKSLKDLEDAAHKASPALRAVDASARELELGAERLAHHAGPVGRILAELGPAGIAAGVGIGATVLAVHKAIEIAREAVESFDHLHDTIENLGINSDLFQGLQFQAKLKGISNEQFTDAIRNAQLRFGELEIGVGRATKQLTIYDSELVKNLKSAGSFEDRLKLIADAMEKETDATKRNLVAKIVFGESNTRMANVLGEGADALDRFVEEAKAFGVVVDRSILERADKMADQMDIASTIIDVNLKQAFIDLAPTIIDITNKVAFLAGVFADIVDSTRDLQNRTREGPLQDELHTLTTQLDELRRRKSEGETEISIPHAAGKAVLVETKSIDDEIAALETHAKEVGGRIRELWADPTVSPEAEATKNAERFQQVSESVDRALTGVATKAEKIAKVRAELDDTIASLEVLRGKPGVDTTELDKTIAAARETADRQIKELQKTEIAHAKSLDDQAVKELRNLSERYSATQKYAEILQKLDAAKARGFLSDQEYASARLRAQEELNDALTKQTEKELEAANTFGSGVHLGLMKVADDASKVAEQISGAIGGAFDKATDAIVDFVTTGKADVSDLATSIIADLLRIEIKQAIVGNIARAFGGLFGGGGAPIVSGLPTWGGPRDGGGPVSPGMLYDIGKGPYREVFSAHSPGAIATANQVAAAMGGGQKSGSLNVNIINPPAPPSVSQGVDGNGERRLDVTFQDMVAKAAGTNRGRRAMNLPPQLTRRSA